MYLINRYFFSCQSTGKYLVTMLSYIERKFTFLLLIISLISSANTERLLQTYYSVRHLDLK